MIKPRIPHFADHGLFRTLAREPTEKRARAGASPRHLRLIGRCHCCVCWEPPPSHPHHLMRVAGEGVKGMARRHADKWAIPLCARHHLAEYGEGAVHHGGDDEAVLAAHGIDGRGLALGLWAETGDLEKMERVNFAHYQRAQLTRAQAEYPGL